jgi:predicted GNAT family N-acyltransferase
MSFTIRAFHTDDIARMNAARLIRDTVFCEEQGVPADIEWDGKDQLCEHFLLEDGNGAIATARVRPYGPSIFKVERVAVLKEKRGLGAGNAIMAHILDSLHGKATIVLNAQGQVEDFYERIGFVRDGDTFEEAGIAHVRMIWQP